MDSPVNFPITEQEFAHNLHLLKETDPFLASQLYALQPHNFKPIYTKRGEPNLLQQATNHTLYDAEGAREEIQTWAKQCAFQNYNTVFVCGIGLGLEFEPFQEWLLQEERNRLIFLEPDLEILFFFLHSPLARNILKHPQVALFWVPSASAWKAMVWDLLWRFWAPHVRTVISPYDQRHRFSTAYSLSAILYHQQWIQKGQLKEHLASRQVFYENFYRNIFALADGSRAVGLFGKFQHVPAIICGAGPSLTQHITQLHDLRDRALLFAGGSALNILSAHGILPHFGGGIDPNLEQLHRLLTNDAFHLPFFFDYRMNALAARQIFGRKLFLQGSGSSPLPTWFEKQLGIEGEEIEQGLNIGNVCMQIAAKMGCNPIILIGFDLAYTDEQTYATGIVRHPLWVEDPDPYCIPVGQEMTWGIDRQGQAVQTNWQWLAESEFIQSLPKSFPAHTWINANQQGLALPSLHSLSLEEVQEKYLKCTYPLDGWVHAEIEEHCIEYKVKQSLFSLCHELEESLERCQNILEQKIAELQRQQEPLCIDWNNEMAYEYLLSRFEQFCLLSLKREEEDWIRQRKPISKGEFQKKSFLKTCEFLLLMTHRQLSCLKSAVREEVFAPSFPSSEAVVHPTPMQGLPVQRHDNGSVKETVEEGTHRFYSSCGVLLAETTFIEGKKEGKTTTFYASGDLAGQQYFEKGVPQGTQRFFFPSGAIQAEIPYRMGWLEGCVSLYSFEGKKRRELFYQQGKRHGRERLWDRFGHLLFEGQWWEGKPCGIAREWLASGPLIREIAYSEPGVRSSILQWDREGRLVKRVDHRGEEDYTPLYEEVEKKVDQLEQSLSFAKEAMEGFLKQYPQPEWVEEWRDILRDLHALEEKKRELRKKGKIGDD